MDETDVSEPEAWLLRQLGPTALRGDCAMLHMVSAYWEVPEVLVEAKERVARVFATLTTSMEQAAAALVRGYESLHGAFQCEIATGEGDSQ